MLRFFHTLDAEARTPGCPLQLKLNGGVELVQNYSGGRLYENWIWLVCVSHGRSGSGGAVAGESAAEKQREQSRSRRATSGAAGIQRHWQR